MADKLENFSNAFKNKILDTLSMIMNDVDELSSHGVPFSITLDDLSQIKKVLEQFEQHNLVKEFLSNSFNNKEKENTSPDTMPDIEHKNECWSIISRKNKQECIAQIPVLFPTLKINVSSLSDQIFSAKRANGQFIITPQKEELYYAHFFDLIKNAVLYVHALRQPYLSENKPRYQCSDMAYIPTRYYIKLFKIREAMKWVL